MLRLRTASMLRRRTAFTPCFYAPSTHCVYAPSTPCVYAPSTHSVVYAPSRYCVYVFLWSQSVYIPLVSERLSLSVDVYCVDVSLWSQSVHLPLVIFCLRVLRIRSVDALRLCSLDVLRLRFPLESERLSPSGDVLSLSLRRRILRIRLYYVYTIDVCPLMYCVYVYLWIHFVDSSPSLRLVDALYIGFVYLSPAK